MAKTYHDADADLSLIQAKKVAIIGYGSQGHAHALNLKDSGVDVRVGLRPDSANVDRARKAGLVVGTVAEVSKWADVIMNLTPDQTAAKVYHAEIEPNMKPNATLMFAHGFNIRFRTITPPAGVDVSLVAPKAPRAHSGFLARAHYRHSLRVPLEEPLLIMAPPRTYKTAFLADVILRYPGPVIATTTKADLYGLTSAVRAQYGPVHVFNPQHIGGVPPTFRWCPVDGCQDPATAIRRADAFAFAVSQKGVEDGSFWSAKASDYLRGYFHAAALAGFDLRAVAAWV